MVHLDNLVLYQLAVKCEEYRSVLLQCQKKENGAVSCYKMKRLLQ